MPWCNRLRGYRFPCRSGAPYASKPCLPRLNPPHTLAPLILAGEPCTGMGCVVDREKTLSLDRCVTLGRRQAGVTQKFLDRPQIAASVEQVSGETVPQSVRGRGAREAKIHAQRFHPALHEARAEGLAAGAYEERAVLCRCIGAGGEVI